MPKLHPLLVCAAVVCAAGGLSPVSSQAARPPAAPALRQRVDTTQWRTYPIAAGSSDSLYGIAADPHGRYEWITNYGGRSLARLDVRSGGVTTYPMTVQVNGATLKYTPADLKFGPDGTLYISGYALGSGVVCGLVTMTTPGAFAFRASPSNECGFGLTVGPDGAIWFPEFDYLARFDPQTGTITEKHYAGSDSQSGNLAEITTGPDGNLWFDVNGYTNAVLYKAVPSTMALTPLAPHYPCGWLAGIAAGGDRQLHTVCERPIYDAVTTFNLMGVSEMHRTLFSSASNIVELEGGDLAFSADSGKAGGLVRINTGTHELSFTASPYGFADYLSNGPNQTIWGVQQSAGAVWSYRYAGT